MKLNVAAFLLLALALSAFISAGTCILPAEETRALLAWHENPTPATKAEVERQAAITLKYRVKLGAALFAFILAVGLPVCVTVSSRSKRTR